MQMQMQIPMQTVLTSPPQLIYPVCHNTRNWDHIQSSLKFGTSPGSVFPCRGTRECVFPKQIPTQRTTMDMSDKDEDDYHRHYPQVATPAPRSVLPALLVGLLASCRSFSFAALLPSRSISLLDTCTADCNPLMWWRPRGDPSPSSGD